MTRQLRNRPAEAGRAARLAPILGAALFFGVACGSDPTIVLPGPVEVIVAGGDSQYGTPGQTLPAPLHVVVRSLTTQLPATGRTISWRVVSGDGQITAPTVSVTDSTGSARATLRLGTSTGEIVVRARVEGEGGGGAEFRLFTVDRPVLDPLPVTTAAPGGSLTLTGSNFSPDPEQNVVLFSGVRGRVTAASGTALTVTVPPCLPERGVDVRVQLGTLASAARMLSVEAGGVVEDPAVGDDFEASDPEGYSCFTLPGDGTAEYLVVAQAAGSIGAAQYPVTLFGLNSGAVAAPLAIDGSEAWLDRTGVVQVRGPRPEGWWREPFARWAGGTDDVQGLWDERLRALEGDALALRGPVQGLEGGPAAVEAPARVPSVGERRTFQVFDAPGSFTQIEAVARVVGARAALFVDEAAPSGGYTDDDLRYYSDLFDEGIEPVVSDAFGAASDLDGNERIIILFSPAVNALTPRGAGGFVAGFFFGVDLLPEQQGSNAAEIFYTLVPDPSGIFSDPRPKAALLDVIPAVLGHEYQHMVNFNERVLKLDAPANDAIWLSEGLAQYAEELVARSYEGGGDAASAELFREGVRRRSRRYLTRPDTVSVLISAGQGSLAERGAGYLLTTYLADRFGADLPGRLTRTTRTGVKSVEFETGTNWPPLLSDWWAATLAGWHRRRNRVCWSTRPSICRGFLTDPYPLEPSARGRGSDFNRGAVPAVVIREVLHCDSLDRRDRP